MIAFQKPTLTGTPEQQLRQLDIWLQGFLSQIELAFSSIGEENLSEAARKALAKRDAQIQRLQREIEEIRE